ncbi:DNRLRE domain-containing protein [Sorangium sp. So ce542]|uniref:DNRLRE domain-containing protein n=1 Tax=Sorangium sp. So ce542 TaxID=3133316 RepID=UPI003F5E438A
MPLLACLGALTTACTAGADDPVELDGPVGQAEQALCAPDDVACNDTTIHDWPTWSQQPDRPDPVIEGEAPDAGTGTLQVQACDPSQLGKLPENPNPKGADLQNITTNFHVLQSIQLLASIVNKTAEAISGLKTEPAADADKGTCVCSQQVSTQCLNVIQQDKTTYEECLDFCDPSSPSADPCSTGVLVWLSNDIQQTQAGKAKWALSTVKWLDKIADEIGGGQFANFLSQFGGELDNISEVMSKIQCYVDQYTEGYHLGSYSDQRPDLHMCIPWAGHGAYANLSDSDRWGIGGRYTSHTLSKERRAQMRTGGFAVTAFGETLSILPGMEFNMQLDGYKWFNREAPLGIEELGHLAGGGVSLDAAKKLGVFYLADEDQMTSLDSDGDGRVSPQEFLIGTYMPFDYTPTDGVPAQLTWPREGAEALEDWEGKSAALLAAALNLDLKLKPIEKELTPIPLPPVPGAYLIPYFKLGAGVKWYDEAYFMRKRLQEALNKNTSHKISDLDFNRDMHGFQAPDVTAEAGTQVSVKPEVGAKLFLGVPIGKLLKVGVEASIGFSVDLRPKGSGGVVDLNASLEQALVNSNPNEDLECKPVFSYKDEASCSNKYIPESSLDLACSPLDTKNSCCITFINGSRACLDDWTGITQDLCSPSKLSYALFSTFLKEKDAKTYKNIFQQGFTTQWSANKSCEECADDGTCPNSLRAPALPEISACAKHGVCCLPAVSSPYGLAYSLSITDGSFGGSRFLQPADLAYDRSGNRLFVADRTAIRRIDLQTGQVTTIAGSSAPGNVDGVGTAARFNTISGITYDAGSLYIADRGARSVRRLNLSTSQVTTIADRTVFLTPRDVAVHDGALFATDSGARTLIRIPLPSGAATTVAGTSGQAGGTDGVGSAARFSEPTNIVADGRGRLYISDTLNNTLRRFDVASAAVTTVAGTSGSAGSADGIGSAARFTAPKGLTVDSAGHVLVVDGNKPGRVRRFDPETSAVTTVSGAPGTVATDGLADDAIFELPAGVAVLPTGDIYVSDTTPATVRKISGDCDSGIPGAVVFDVTEAECPGNFDAYSCLSETKADATEWQGPGCHPLQTGFPSACGCTSNADCASGETCDVEAKVCTVGGTPVDCVCTAQSTCPNQPGRACVNGACARHCTYSPSTASTACGQNEVCTPGGTCEPKAGPNVPYAEEVIWGMKNGDDPTHAIATYGLTEIELIAALNAGIHVGLEAKLFKKWKKFTLWKWRRTFDIGSVSRYKFQPGLEATYQWDTSPLGDITNYQPGEVTRYAQVNASTADFLEWCKDEMPLHSADPLPPTTDDVVGGVEDVVDFGFDVGETVSSAENLCINGQPMTDWLQDQGALTDAFVTGTCSYVGPQTGSRGSLSFPCQEAHRHLLKHWGCLDTQRTATSFQLAIGDFSGAVVNPGTAHFDLTKVLVDPDAGLEPENLAKRTAMSEAWLAEVETCFDDHYEDTIPCACQTDADCTTGPGLTCVSGTCQTPENTVAECSVVENAGVTVERCCGDGVQQASEQCDDGNTVSGDGCSALCKPESKGACCRSGGCTDLGQGGISSGQSCASAGGSFISGYSCAEVDACGSEPVGACHEADGTCHDPTTQSQCAAVPGAVFTVNGACENPVQTLTLQPGGEGVDAMIRGLSANVNTNYGNAVNLTAGSWTSPFIPHPWFRNRSLLRFDFSQLPAGATVEQARLSLYADPDATLYYQGITNTEPPGHSTVGGSNAFLLQRVTAAWQENTVTWSNQPASTTANEVLLPQSTSTSQDYENIDVTALVRDMLTGTGNNHGFMIRLQSEADSYREVSFTSSDYATAHRRPKLVIKYRNP